MASFGVKLALVIAGIALISAFAFSDDSNSADMNSDSNSFSNPQDFNAPVTTDVNSPNDQNSGGDVNGIIIPDANNSVPDINGILDSNSGGDVNGSIDLNSIPDFNGSVDLNSTGDVNAADLNVTDLNGFDGGDVNSSSGDGNSSGDSGGGDADNPQTYSGPQTPGIAELRAEISRLDLQYSALKSALKDSADAEKPALRSQMMEKARLILLMQSELILAQLEGLKTQGVSSEEVIESIDFISGKKALLMAEQVSGADLVAISSDLHGFWAEKKPVILRAVLALSLSKLSAASEKIYSFAASLEGVSSGLEAAGKDVALLKNGITKLRSDYVALSLASDKISSAGNALADGDPSEFYENARVSLALANAVATEDYDLMGYLYFAAKGIDSSGLVSEEIASKINSGITSALSAELEASLSAFG